MNYTHPISGEDKDKACSNLFMLDSLSGISPDVNSGV